LKVLIDLFFFSDNMTFRVWASGGGGWNRTLGVTADSCKTAKQCRTVQNSAVQNTREAAQPAQTRKSPQILADPIRQSNMI
jgi:hypothetical protein